jgi:hypothetical protein
MTPDYTAMEPSDAEQVIFSRLTTYAEDERTRYAEIGLMADTVERLELWRQRIDPQDGFPCRSFGRWASLCPYPNSTLYAAKADVQALSDVPADDLAQIPMSNLKTMRQLSTAVRSDPKVLDVAKSQRTDALVAYIKDKHPTQHLERDEMFRCPLNETQMADVEGAIAKAMNRGCASRSEALWMLAVDYLSNDIPLEDVECKGAVQ